MILYCIVFLLYIECCKFWLGNIYKSINPKFSLVNQILLFNKYAMNSLQVKNGVVYGDVIQAMSTCTLGSH